MPRVRRCLVGTWTEHSERRSHGRGRRWCGTCYLVSSVAEALQRGGDEPADLRQFLFKLPETHPNWPLDAAQQQQDCESYLAGLLQHLRCDVMLQRQSRAPGHTIEDLFAMMIKWKIVCRSCGHRIGGGQEETIVRLPAPQPTKKT